MGRSGCGGGVCGRGILVVGRDGAAPGVCGGTARPAPACWRERQGDEPEPSAEGRGLRACLPRCAPTPCAGSDALRCRATPHVCCLPVPDIWLAGPPGPMRVLAAFRRCCVCMCPDCTQVDAHAPGYAVRPAAQPRACTLTKDGLRDKCTETVLTPFFMRGATLRPLAGHPQGDRATTKSKLYAPATSRLDWREYRSRLIKVSS
jgi:hypothetical protein